MLRLVCPDNHDAPSQAIEVLVRYPGSSTPLVRILLEIPGPGGIPIAMPAPSANLERAADSPRPQDPVAGRIDAQPSALSAALEAWLSNRAVLGKKPKGVAAYRQTIEAAIKRTGWRDPSQLTFDNISRYLDQSRAELGWTGGTYNRNLTVFRSFTKHACRRRLLPEDPMIDIDRAIDDDGDGSRAATVDEARKIISFAFHRQTVDRRSRGDRALYWLCLFATGSRVGEPEQWRWKHLLLDEPIPVIRWTKDIQKNGKLQECALAPELIVLLRRHRETMRALAVKTPAFTRSSDLAPGPKLRLVDPENPESFVFPMVPPRHTFRTDRSQAGIVEFDSRGRRFSPHSARKFFSTVMTQVGVSQKMVDRLMRHAGTVESRYYDPSSDEMAQALTHLPRLWPQDLGNDQPARPAEAQNPIVDNFWTSPLDLTDVRGLAHHPPANPEISPIDLSSSRGALSGFALWTGPAWARPFETPEQAPTVERGTQADRSTDFLSGNAERRTRTADLDVMNVPL